jgi:uncharacterized protein (TIGR02301 family)
MLRGSLKMPKIRALALALSVNFMMFTFILPAHENAQAQSSYLTQKRDLAGVLGEVHFIRTLCNGANDQFWRNYMRDFLSHEASSEQLRSMFIKAFNRGYKYQSQQLFSCNTKTAKLEQQLATKGRELAESIALSYVQ